MCSFLMSMNSRSFGPDGHQDDKRLQDDNITRDGQSGRPVFIINDDNASNIKNANHERPTLIQVACRAHQPADPCLKIGVFAA